ncbi:protein TPX2-like [Lactuca sativa]|uniref:protein TPX2-like n=1 Tax=Lactuca sativa TaxID=4236 RepID=UPI001C6906EE|nr:protein TPX2-like [Lactuca sativa]
MAKIPKFKARPVNKKILEAPTLPAMKRSTPQVLNSKNFVCRQWKEPIRMQKLQLLCKMNQPHRNGTHILLHLRHHH